MEIINALVPIVQNLGVPVVCLGVCFWYIWKRDEDWKIREEDYQEMVYNLSDVINNNTLTIQRLIDKVDGEK